MIGLGSINAMQRKYELAIASFTAAIAIDNTIAVSIHEMIIYGYSVILVEICIVCIVLSKL